MIEDTRGYREMMRITHDGFLELPRLMKPDITPRPLWECQVLLASYRLVCFSLACLLSDIPLKIHPIGMHFVPIKSIKRSVSLSFHILAFSLLSFTTQRFFGNYLPIFNNVHQSFFFVRQF